MKDANPVEVVLTALLCGALGFLLATLGDLVF